MTGDRIYVSSAVTGGPRAVGEGAVLSYTADGDHLWTHPLGEDTAPVTPPVAHADGIFVAGGWQVVAIAERDW